MKTVGIKGLGPVTLEVYNPTGTLEITHLHAPRLTDLRGKTICELSNGWWQDIRTFASVRESLQKRFPDLKIIPLTEFPVGAEQMEKESTIDMVVQRGCEAVITGNAA